MKRSLRSRITLSITLVTLISITIISSFSIYFVDQQFKNYIARQEEISINEIAANLSQQFDTDHNTWDINYVHTIGMYALYDGYIIKVFDQNNNSVWDAEKWDMTQCIEVKDSITHRMLTKYPLSNGKFSSTDFPIILSGQNIGIVNITYFGPYFFNENDFRFLTELFTALISVAVISLLLSVLIGFYSARRISKPILKTIDATGQISQGNYAIRIDEKSNVKEVDQLIRSVNHLAGSLGKQENLKKQLTSDVAHELRTPLTTLQTHMEAMIEGVWEPTTQRLQSCHDEILRITKIVKDLESLEIVENGNLVLEKTDVNLNDVISVVLKNFEIQLSQKMLTLQVEGTSPIISADLGRISQVVINLLNNAIKYTHEGGEIRIKLSESEGNAVMQIQDNGVGISLEELPYIFERFYRADKSRNRMTGGSGIGLTIVKSIILAHDGVVEVQSELGKGSVFTVTLPKKQVQE